MTTNRRPSRSAALALALLAACWGPVGRTPGQSQGPSGRQVVMFGVLATPGSSEMDPKISKVVAARLRRTLPGYGFKLIDVRSKRVPTGRSTALDLGDNYVATAQLLDPLDVNGKVQMRFDLSLDGLSLFQSIVATPADQFNFFDKALPDDTHLLIGVGAR